MQLLKQSGGVEPLKGVPGVGIDYDKLTFRGAVSIMFLILSKGRVEVWKSHGKAALVEI
jgi:hypothetical protein